MRFTFKPVYALILAVTLIAIWLQPASASTLVDSRIRQLEFQVRSLQSQISSIPAVRQQAGNTPPPSIDIATPPGDPTLAQQFDNLAILAIELKQRVTALEEQVAQLSQ